MRSTRLILITGCIAVFLAATPAFAASAWTEPASGFAQRIADKVGGSPITVTVRNLSSLSSSEFSDARAQILTQLHGHGMKIVEKTRTAAGVSITLSENAQGYLWIANIALPQANEDIVMLRVAPAQSASMPRTTPAMVLRKKLLWSQRDGEEILDATPFEVVGGPSVLVLTPSRVTLHVFYGTEWKEEFSSLLPARGIPRSRDPRGRLVLRHDHLFDLYLPGQRCSSTNRLPIAVNCIQSDDPWPLDSRESLQGFYAPARNFFNGTLTGPSSGGKTVAPFFSAAKVADNGTDLWVFAGIDGRVRLFDGGSDTSATVLNWGSDIAGLKTGCGAGSQVLATRPGEGDDGDAIQTYEFVRSEAVPVSEPIEFPGPVTALWSAETGTTAIVRNANTNQYEAYSLSLDCGR